MRIYGFNAPQERIEPKLWKSTQDFTHVNTGRFVRNAVLSGMCYGGNDLVPAFLKTCDAVHPLCGTEDFDGVAQSCYGALLDSVNNATTKAAIKSVCQPWNTSVVWAPGGRGLDSWLAVRLPEATLIERYAVASTNTTCPLSWKLQGSLDGSTWADLDEVTNTEMWSLSTAHEEKIFTIPEVSRGTYLWYRLYVTASNAATMSIRNFRLWRAQSVCDRGQLRLDASAGSPLLLSFMNGFATDGVTPVDYDESLSAAIVQALGDYDSEGLPMISGAGAVPVDIFAKRDASGSVVVSVEAATSEETEYLAGGMISEIDRGFTAQKMYDNNYLAHYLTWGRGGSSQYTKSKLSRTNGQPFYLSRFLCSQYQSSYYNPVIYITEIDGNTTRYNITSNDARDQKIVRNIQSITTHDGYYSFVGGVRLFYFPRSAHRLSNGKVYQRKIGSTSWTPVQKIKIASAVYNGTDLYQLQPRSSLLMQWMTNGDNVTYLDA